MTCRLTCQTTAFLTGLVLASAALAEQSPTISLANGTDHVFSSITVFDMLGDDALGGTIDPLRPGESVTIPLSLPVCMQVYVQAVFDSKKLIEANADACDGAIYTLTDY